MYRQQEPEVNLDQILGRFKSIFGGVGRGGGKAPFVILAVIIIGVVIWFATGFFTVQPGEKAALRLFGTYSDTKDPGLQWWWPGPIGA